MMDDLMKQAADSAAISGVSSKVTVASGTGTAIYSMVSSDHVFAIVGIVCTIATFIVTWYYKRREFKLKQEHMRFEQQIAREAEDRLAKESLARIEAMTARSLSSLIPLEKE